MSYEGVNLLKFIFYICLNIKTKINRHENFFKNPGGRGCCTYRYHATDG